MSEWFSQSVKSVSPSISQPISQTIDHNNHSVKRTIQQLVQQIILKGGARNLPAARPIGPRLRKPASSGTKSWAWQLPRSPIPATTNESAKLNSLVTRRKASSERTKAKEAAVFLGAAPSKRVWSAEFTDFPHTVRRWAATATILYQLSSHNAIVSAINSIVEESNLQRAKVNRRRPRTERCTCGHLVCNVACCCSRAWQHSRPPVLTPCVLSSLILAAHLSKGSQK